MFRPIVVKNLVAGGPAIRLIQLQVNIAPLLAKLAPLRHCDTATPRQFPVVFVYSLFLTGFIRNRGAIVVSKEWILLCFGAPPDKVIRLVIDGGQQFSPIISTLPVISIVQFPPRPLIIPHGELETFIMHMRRIRHGRIDTLPPLHVVKVRLHIRHV